MADRADSVPAFSVIIPTFNRARFVTRAIDSVLRQTWRDREVIVIDDGSTDNTRDVLRPYAGTVNVLFQKNSGVSAARNAGIRKAAGAWIAFLDSDDEWKPEYLFRQKQSVDAHPQAVAHITNAVAIHADGSSNPHFRENLLRQFGRDHHLIIQNPFQTIINHPHWYLQSTIMRRDILLRIGLFNAELTIAEDLDLIARLALEGPFGLTREVLVETYRRREAIDHLGLQKEKQAVRTCELFEQVYAGLYGTHRLTLRERIVLARAMSANRRALGNFHLKDGNTAIARECYKKGFIAYPSGRSFIKYLASFLPPRFSQRLTRTQ